MTTAEAPRCNSCRKPLHTDELTAGCWVCRPCERTAYDQLRAMPDLFRRVDSLSALMKGSSSGGIGSPTRDASAPVKLGVLDLTVKGGAVTRLQAIEDAWRKTLGWSMGTTRHHADIDGVTTFLINNLRWACERYAEVADDLLKIRSLHGQMSSVDTGVRPLRRFTVYCDTADCTGQMRITLNSERATCPECDTPYDKHQLGRLDSQYGPNPNREDAAA